MQVRFGDVVYWLACCVAGLLALMGALASYNDHAAPLSGIIIYWPIAVVIFLIGRGLRYVIAGR